MKIENVRLGLATNSSSMHSLIFNLDAESRDWEDAEFGWNEFCCNCYPSKQMYLAAVLYQNMQGQLGDNIARTVVKAWLGLDLPKDSDYFCGVDHQSLMSLPVNPKTGQVDQEFFDALAKEYLKPEVAIVGGNDNEDPRIFTTGRERHLLPTEDRAGEHVCRKDPETGHWVLFNRTNGTKIRMHFDKKALPYTRAFAPELVDIKITNCCQSDCEYCYQESKPEGIHADKDELERIIWAMDDMGVFEVALGGGEPTMHPYFPKLLKRFRQRGIVPNFTTRSYKWLHDEGIREAVRQWAGKFAVSIQYADQMVRAFHFADELGMSNANYDYDRNDWNCRMGFQYVMGTSSLREFRKIVRSIPWNMELTLLGYKKKGRGRDYQPEDYSGWVDVIKISEHRHAGKIGIDTALAQEYRREILELVDERLVTFEEGKFSMYIDAVNDMAAPSSYCDEKDFVDLRGKGFRRKDWLKLFQRF